MKGTPQWTPVHVFPSSHQKVLQVSNSTVLAFGQANLADATDALFLKVFGGEVITAFERECKAKDAFFTRNIKSGKSAQFPVTHKVVASYHTPGNEILGQTSAANEKVIVVDDVLIAPVFLADIDEAKSHFDVRSIYSNEAGFALANQYDSNVLQCAVLAARASALVTGGNGGGTSTSTTTLYKTSATDLAAGIYLAMQSMDEKDIPAAMERKCWVKPAQFYLLAQSTALLNRDWGGSGSYADGSIPKIGGAHIVKTNNLPTTLVSTGVAKYQGDFTKTAAVITNNMAVGTVKLLDLSVRADYDPRRLGTLVNSKYAVGHDVLRPDCSFELKTTA